MLYLSQVLGRPVREVEGERVATLKDVIVRLGSDHPPVTGIVARYRRRDFFVPRARVASIDTGGVRLNSDILDLRRFARRDGEVLLARDVLDKQLIDVDGKRVVRVNDVQLIESGGENREALEASVKDRPPAITLLPFRVDPAQDFNEWVVEFLPPPRRE